MGYPRISLYVEEWPEGDQRLWQQANADGGYLEPSGKAAHWTDKSRKQVAKDYGRFLFVLKEAGRLDERARPSDRLTLENLRLYLESLQSCDMAHISLLSRVRHLHMAFRVMEPGLTFPKLLSVIAKLNALAEPTRDKHSRLVDPALLNDKALALYDNLVRKHPSSLTGRAAHQARDALMLALMAHRPIRLANFTSLTIGRHLVRSQEGYTLYLPDNETKDHRDYASPVPAVLVPYLDHYLGKVRPQMLRGSTTDRLWISTRGTAVSDSTVYYQVNKITKKLIGHAINPHLIRDCVMTMIASDRPENVMAGARLLGHRSLQTSEVHYNQATSLAAQRQHSAVIKALRDSDESSSPKPQPRTIYCAPKRTSDRARRSGKSWEA
jgi:integrase/recombinase XerD